MRTVLGWVAAVLVVVAAGVGIEAAAGAGSPRTGPPSTGTVSGTVVAVLAGGRLVPLSGLILFGRLPGCPAGTAPCSDVLPTAKVEVGADGRFAVRLAPGDWVVAGMSTRRAACGAHVIAVRAGDHLHENVVCHL